jgi:hypothetical protein
MTLRQRLLVGGMLNQMRLTPSITNQNLEDYKYLMTSVFDTEHASCPTEVSWGPKAVHGLLILLEADCVN